MRTIAIASLCALAGLFFSCKEQPKKEVLTEKKVEAVKPKAEPVKPKEEVKPVCQPDFHVVAGCFEFRENAERLHARLKEAGHDSRILPFYNLHMVTYAGYGTRAEAQAALNRIVYELEDEHAWVYPVQ